MVAWSEVAAEEPEFAERARALFEAHRHKILATLRKDGSPRISGIEAGFADDGHLYLGMMHESRKALDLRRDPRFALHSGSADPPDEDPSSWTGDVKLSGQAEEIVDPDEIATFVKAAGPPPGPFHLFRLDVAEVVLTKVGEPADHLVIEHWQAGSGLRRFRRE